MQEECWGKEGGVNDDCMIRSSLHCMALRRLDLVMVASRLDTDYLRRVDHSLRLEVLLPLE